MRLPVVARVLSMSVLLATGIAAPAARAAESDYRWALPDWRQTWSGGPLSDDRGFAVRATDDAVYVAGVSGSGDGGGDVLLQRYALDGTLVWSRTWGGAGLDQAQGLAISGDDIYVVGSEAGTGDGVSQSVLLRYDLDGVLQAQRSWNVGITSAAQAVVARGDSIYVAGLTHPTAANRDLYIARLRAADLGTAWQKRWGGERWDEAWDLQADANRLYAVGYTTTATEKTDNLLLLIDPASGAIEREVVWGGPGNDEARAVALDGGTLWIAGGGQKGTSGDAFLAKASTAGDVQWTRSAAGAATGGYGVAVGARGIYVAGGSYDFPAGGDAAIVRFSREGAVEWSQVFGLPGFWDWGFDVDARDGRFYVTGTLYTPGEEWYEILTTAYSEDFQTIGLSDVAAGDPRTAAALAHLWIGDLLRWARGPKAEGDTGAPSDGHSGWADEDAGGDAPQGSGGGLADVRWFGASDFGRRSGEVRVGTDREPPVSERNAADALTGLARDLPSNPALVRDYTGVQGSLLGGAIRFRYVISHDRLIPQGGFITAGGVTVPLPPPPV